MSDAVVEYRLAEAGASSKHDKSERGRAVSPQKASSSSAKGPSPKGNKGASSTKR